ncbi:MAG TPA: SAM-dependent methyltransferase [Gammaproteobacteria bacterium]|nr:SAM-dependent methyltransferase [Gammaproteobacteria bacterium]
MTRRTRASGHWRQRQQDDPYVRRAAKERRRSRAVFKLEQINARERILRSGMLCIDLGAAPGGWSQYAAGIVGRGGGVVAVDLLPMAPIEGVELIEADFTAAGTPARVLEALQGARADIVMSDMAPNISGSRSVDQPRAMQLAEDALDFCREALKPGGTFLVKLFQGEGFEEFVRSARAEFTRVRLVKPKASRPDSREIYLLATGYAV